MKPITDINYFFEVGEPICQNPTYEKSIQAFRRRAKCKLCGVEIEGATTDGMFHSGMSFLKEKQEDHIELHKTQKLLESNEKI